MDIPYLTNIDYLNCSYWQKTKLLFAEGKRNLKIACSTDKKLHLLICSNFPGLSHSLQQTKASITCFKRIKLIAVGMLLLLPCIHFIAYRALHFLGCMDTFLPKLPRDAWITIFNKLDKKQLQSARQVCRAFNTYGYDRGILTNTNVEAIRPWIGDSMSRVGETYQMHIWFDKYGKVWARKRISYTSPQSIKSFSGGSVKPEYFKAKELYQFALVVNSQKPSFQFIFEGCNKDPHELPPSQEIEIDGTYDQKIAPKEFQEIIGIQKRMLERLDLLLLGTIQVLEEKQAQNPRKYRDVIVKSWLYNPVFVGNWESVLSNVKAYSSDKLMERGRVYLNSTNKG